MSLHLTVLGSGSAGNASLVEADDFVVLLDIGLGPRQLARRLRAVGRSWKDVRAVLLTHTHSDHCSDRTLAHLKRLRIPFYCHAAHRGQLRSYFPKFSALEDHGLVREFAVEQPIRLARGLHGRALPLSHDSDPTFGFRFDEPDAAGYCPALGYIADLGTWTTDLARDLVDVDVLAVEFNHDIDLQYRSGRPAHLIARIIGDSGHLSNNQAAGFLREVIRLSTPGRLRHVVQLHLSRECNEPSLARDAANQVLRACEWIDLHTAVQETPGPRLPAAPYEANLQAIPRRRRRPWQLAHPLLPGIDW